MSKPYKIGVIGGMGPEASSYYYQEVIKHTQVEKDQDHIDLVILSHSSLPDRTKAIQTGNDGMLIKLLQEDALLLEQIGVSYIVITCNTSHYFLEEVQKSVNIPIINMIQETVDYILEVTPKTKRIGIMATDGTMESKIYHQACLKRGIEPYELSPSNQSKVMELIYKEIKKGLKPDKNKFESAMKEFQDASCDAVILGCTELSVYKGQHHVPHFCVDAMDVLVRKTLFLSNKTYVNREEEDNEK